MEFILTLPENLCLCLESFFCSWILTDEVSVQHFFKSGRREVEKKDMIVETGLERCKTNKKIASFGEGRRDL